MSTKFRYFIHLAYNGKAYHGWQLQENAISVQQLIDEGFSTVFAEKLSVTGAGRTDTGVHARDFYAHFDLEKKMGTEEIVEKVYKLNSYLPADISIFKITPVNADAHARFSARSRTYEYLITSFKDPFNTDFAWQTYANLDIDLMNTAAAILLDHTDFTSFSKLHTQVKTNNCNVMEAAWEKRGNLLVFTIRADRFLRNMVRAIVGTLVDVGRGKISLVEFEKIIEAKDRSEAGLSVPAHGLYLINVEYEEDIYLKEGR